MDFGSITEIINRLANWLIICLIVGLIALISLCWFIVVMVKKAIERNAKLKILNTRIDANDAIRTEDEADRKAKEYE
jgi:uncharacterized SAM-binding protein YcdF (DUF218 family)